MSTEVDGGSDDPPQQGDDPTPPEQIVAGAEAAGTPSGTSGYPPTPEEIFKGTGSASARMLAHLLSLSPFLELHYRADHPEDHHLRATVCFILDSVLRAVVAVLLLLVVVGIAWKTLAPLPHFWDK